ncbi:MAG: alcohol dehydrogenase catalytic domain-containing protein [Firmicutes bacterium]|nr:alcohol dehydrogenase catalytic domain-containing protein [Bacillota bacterium]
MKAAVVHALNDLRIEEVPEPALLDDSVMIRVEACAICGTDLRIYRRGDKRAKLPQVIGHETAGIIEAAGPLVKGLKVGDRVTVAPGISCGSCRSCQRGYQNLCENMISIGYAWPGGFAQYHVPPGKAITEGFVNKIPDGVSYEDASLAEIIACCINGQERVGINEGDTVVVIGAGPAGCVHVELARARGAGKIILANRSPGRLEAARKFSADVFVNAGQEDLVARVFQETDGWGADVVIVACASKEAQAQAVQMVAKRGRISFFGGLAHSDSLNTLDANIVHYRECIITGASSSTGRGNREALELIASGKIDTRKLITHVIPLDQIEEGFRLMESREGMKVVVKPWV